MLALVLIPAAFAGAPLQITVPADATHVTLKCATRTLEGTPVKGLVTFAEAPANCAVNVTYKLGTVSGAGIYSCTADGGCVLDDVPHAPISDAAGRVNVVFSGVYDTKWFEMSCNSGEYRQRMDIVDNTATFNDVPSGECTLFFKGGTPAQYRGVTAASWRCSLTGTTAVCSKFTP